MDGVVSVGVGDWIASANDEFVVLRGYNAGDDCFAFVPREMFHEMIDGWLDKKSDFRNRYSGEFCGVGVIHLTVEPLPNLPDGYLATGYQIDMEHG